MDLRYAVTPVPGAVSVGFAQDFRIDVAFIDSRTGETIADFTGDRSVLMSTLLAAMPPEALRQFVEEVAVRMTALAEGVDA
jgi:hypothetical protein